MSMNLFLAFFIPLWILVSTLVLVTSVAWVRVGKLERLLSQKQEEELQKNGGGQK